MKMLLPLVAVAAPVSAQESQTHRIPTAWPVHAQGDACTLVQSTTDGDSTLSVEYDGTEVTLVSTSRLESTLPASGRVPLDVVFLENAGSDARVDNGWGARDFAYRQNGDVYRFSTRFAGERNVRQILADLARSRTLGLLQAGEPVVAYDLAGIAESIERLRSCGASSMAAR